MFWKKVKPLFLVDLSIKKSLTLLKMGKCWIVIMRLPKYLTTIFEDPVKGAITKFKNHPSVKFIRQNFKGN